MATAFIDLHEFIKRLIGDGDSECSLYGVDLLNSQIRLSILLLNNGDITEDGSTAIFVLDLTNQNKLKVILQSAINILDPLPELFIHKGPILSVTRRRSRDYVEQLKETLDDLNGGKFAFATDTVFMAIMNSFDRWVADFDSALASQ